MDYLTAVHTDAGVKKNKNQDSVLMETAVTDYEKVLLCVVCDGMGGLEKGEVASAILVKAFSDWFRREFPGILYKKMEADTIKGSWRSLILEQNRKIKKYGWKCHVCMGTTVAALLLVNHTYYILNVGDSRVYYLKGNITQITVDQTFVQREVHLGRMTSEEAENHPRRNALLQCVGAGCVPEPDFYTGEFERESVFMVCSDGFRHKIRPEEFSERLNPAWMCTEETLKENAVYFTELNKSRGEEDNISVALIRSC